MQKPAKFHHFSQKNTNSLFLDKINLSPYLLCYTVICLPIGILHSYYWEYFMGYTHYFTQHKMVDDSTWEKINQDIRKIISVTKRTIPVQCDALDDDTHLNHDDFICHKDWINFNGVGDDGHETFYVPRHQPGFLFCKTNRKPYDLLVCASLLIIYHYAPDCYEITSNGKQQEWMPAMSMNAQYLGYAYALPTSIRAYNYDDFIVSMDDLALHSQQKTVHAMSAIKMDVQSLVQGLNEGDASQNTSTETTIEPDIETNRNLNSNLNSDMKKVTIMGSGKQTIKHRFDFKK
jgi:hypothetical protein